MEEGIVLEEMIETIKLMVRDKNLAQTSQTMKIFREEFQEEIIIMLQS